MMIHKILFATSAMTGVLVTMSSYSWMTMWMGLEINLLSILPLFLTQKNILSTEASMKYFITQALASLILLMSVILMMLTSEFISPQMNFHFLMFLNSSLMIKLGAAPFHFWLPEVMEGLSWPNCLILMTIQKIAPLTILMNNKTEVKFIVAIIVASAIIGSISSINQTSLRKIMAFSSITHLAWMLASILLSKMMLITYFSIYTLMNLNLIYWLYASNMFFTSQMTQSPNKFLQKLAMIISLMTLGGLPPFIGFLPKWMIINQMTSINLQMPATMLIMSSLIMLFTYSRMMIPPISQSIKLYTTKYLSPIPPMLSIFSMINLPLWIPLINWS